MFKNLHSFVLALATISAIGLAANVQAEIVKVYDFENITTGSNIGGNDNWILKVGYADKPAYVSSGAAGWTGNYAEISWSGADSQLVRLNDDNWTYSIPANTNFDVSIVLATGSDATYNTAIGGLQEGDVNGYSGLKFGITKTDLKWWNNAGTAVVALGTNVSGHTFLMGVSVTAEGSGVYSGQAYYQDLTASGQKTNIGSPFILASDPTTWNALSCRLNTPSSSLPSRMDTFTIVIDAVPEPSSLALLACGLIGLLAYAWRKRK